MFDIREMTRQEVFNRAMNGLASQFWERSEDWDGCMYFGPEGRRCPVGWLCDGPGEAPEEYRQVQEYPHDLPEFGEHYNLLVDLQFVHDYVGGDLREAFGTYAEENGLRWEVSE